MTGHDLEQLPCTYCHRNVVDVDATWDQGLAYHSPCFKLSLSNEIKQYQKKVELGSITMSEANRMQELQGVLNIVRESDKKPRNPPKIKSRNILRSGASVFMLSPEHRQKFFENQKKVIQKNELLRETRWKQEAIETQKIKQISNENIPSFPLENMQKTDEKNDLKNGQNYPT